MTIKAIDPSNYNVPKGHPRLHENLAWYATEDDKVVGTLIRDKMDNDFSWVVLKKEGSRYTAVDLGHSLVTAEAARQKLFAAMEEAHVQD